MHIPGRPLPIPLCPNFDLINGMERINDALLAWGYTGTPDKMIATIHEEYLSVRLSGELAEKWVEDKGRIISSGEDLLDTIEAFTVDDAMTTISLEGFREVWRYLTQVAYHVQWVIAATDARVELLVDYVEGEAE